ncbi:glycosylase [Planctomyces sp. SH-PL62]|uniref:glycosylase n=1 Tax=Planctomyces sp. SH-PL62 TaxID=1636152 RepID=UPI00078BDBB1|nr:glycosylase [Planctomyces sp. SH-PL62]AMV40446.1 Glycosyl hydrolases family 43 [Planctomyces sp. SH-PL62]
MRKSLVRWVLGMGCLVLGGAGRVAGEEPWRFTSWRPVAGNPVFQGTGEGTWDRNIRERGFILPEGDGYTLWYTGFDSERSGGMALGRATSRDGKAWRRDPGNPVFAKSWVEDVCVVRADGTYQMFAEGRGDIIHRLSSPDGVHWTDHGSLDVRKVDGSPIGPGSFGTPTAWYEDGVWHLLYERRDDAIWLATSRDFKVWTNVKDEPVLARGPEPFDRGAVAVNQVVRRDGFYYLFYHALAEAGGRDWTTNVARSRDLIQWEKYPRNPIIGDNCSSAVLVPTPQGDRLYTMHPNVKVFEPAGD